VWLRYEHSRATKRRGRPLSGLAPLLNPGHGRARGGTAASPAAAAAGSSLQELQLITQRSMKLQSQNPFKPNSKLVKIQIQGVAVTFRYESGGARDEDRLAVKALRDPGVFHGEPRAGRQWRALESPHSSRSPETSRWWWGRVGYRLLAPSGVAGLGNKRKVAVL